jgi:hypothetical protein
VVAFGPDNAAWDVAWRKLYSALSLLAHKCAGTFAFVIDGGNGLWCVARAASLPTTSTPNEDRAADRFYEKELAPRLTEMRRGKRLEIAKRDGDDRYVATTFAGIYCLVVWFEDAFVLASVQTKIERMLPEIEALVVALPPPGGPGCDTGAMKARA